MMYHVYAIIIILLLIHIINIQRVIAENTKKIGEILIIAPNAEQKKD